MKALSDAFILALLWPPVIATLRYRGVEVWSMWTQAAVIYSFFLFLTMLAIRKWDNPKR